MTHKIPRVYVYKLTTDNGGAPCIYKGRLSLAICKPGIRRTAKENDWIFGFGGKDLKQRLIYIARVTKRLENGTYYDDDAYEGRSDRIYRRDGGKYIWRRGARYHQYGTELEHDLGKAPGYQNAVTLLSDDFRYWGKRGTCDYREQFPDVAALLDRLRRGHRVNLSDEVRRKLERLQSSQWRSHPNTKVLGSPTEGDRKKVCNGSEGGMASASIEP